MPNMDIENKYKGVVAGIDEAGRGPWAGPVVAAAVILDRNNIPQGINDSKKLSAKQRLSLYNDIKKFAIVGVGMASVEEIDRINILNATKLAMIRAYKNLIITPQIVLIDGNQTIDIEQEVVPVIKGDSISYSIAAASIIAKVTRDKIMSELSINFPHFGWERNAGYGTKLHSEGLNKYGVTIHHRKSFAPIKKLLQA